MDRLIDQIKKDLTLGKDLWLFLDYDGTLADFAKTPDVVTPDPKIIDLITRLSRHKHIHISIISGRRLAHVRKLVPVPGILLAGTYGIEMLLATGEEVHQVEYLSIRPALEQIRPRWEELIKDKPGYYLEDKGYAIALHCSEADPRELGDIISQARAVIKESLPPEPFRVIDGSRFLEVCHALADKGETVRYIAMRFAGENSQYLYIGDDARDEDAFKTIQQLGGYCIQVGNTAMEIKADLFLESPIQVLDWLEQLIAA